MSKSNPMAVKYYSTKVEFQGRGAAHNHGVLWVDIDRMELYVENEKNNWLNLNDILASEDSKSRTRIKNKIKVALKKIYSQNTSENARKTEKEYVQNFYKNFVQKNSDDIPGDKILKKFPLYGVVEAFKKFQTKEDLLPHEEAAIISFTNKFTTCTLNKATIESKTNNSVLKERSGEVVKICECVNIHAHTQTCKKYDTTCRFYFGKYPMWETIISKPCTLPESEEKEKLLAKYKKILSDVREILDNYDIIQEILSEYPDKKSESQEEYVKNRKVRIEKVLQKAGLVTPEDINLYAEALRTSLGGYSIILERDIDEMYVNSYNPEWARAWNGNHDIQICLDYYAVITYITEYFTKDDSGTMKLLLDALRQNPSQELREKMKLLMKTFISARQMGECEALYKIFPDLNLKKSNVVTVFVPVSRKEERSKFLLKIDENINYNGQQKIKIYGRDGYFVEKYDIISKFERCIGKGDMSYTQFAKMYTPAWTKNEKKQLNENEYDTDDDDENFEQENDISKFDYVLKCSNPQNYSDHELCKSKLHEKLPQYLDLSEVFPGEPPFMRKRRAPAVLRFHNFKESTHPQEYFFSQALLYLPFETEEKLENYLKNKPFDEEISRRISCVKSQVMEFLENVEEARYFIEEERRNAEIENLIAPSIIQEEDDCQYEGIIDHPEFPDLGIEVLEENRIQVEKGFRMINLDETNILLEKTRKLDYHQRKVVEIGIHYARTVVKALKSRNRIPEAPCLTVLGGAGSGKSTVINILKQWMHLIVQCSGDNPNFPYVIVAAPTGTAAANVNGQTMHSAFSFTYGNEHFSLSDKKKG